MNKLYTFLAAILLTATTFAQTPEKMSYQAVVRDSGDALVTNQAVGIQISILQTTAAGTAIYVETQTPTSNINGLVTLEIGTGNVLSGNFSIIDWSTDTYFIKTEIDPTGGSSYTITGTSQLLSVPYALHAKTADSMTGIITESQISDLSHTVEVDGSVTNEIELPTTGNAGDMNYWNGSAWVAIETTPNEGATLQMISGKPTWTGGIPPTVGDDFQGGIVAYVFVIGDPGFIEGETHGLIAAPSNQSTGSGIQWYNGAYTTIGATGTALGTGNANTTAIVTNQGAGSYAAKLCSDLVLGGYSDWYLPSRDELAKLYDNKDSIGNFDVSSYWSSTEADDFKAWKVDFWNGYQFCAVKLYDGHIRAIRSF